MAALHRNHPRRSGFSLVELVLVLSIISVFSAIAVPRYANSIARHHAESTAQRIVADLAYARTLAITTSRDQPVVFDIANSAYALSNAAGLDNRSSAYRTDLKREPYVSEIFSASFGGSATVTFNLYGIPSNGGTILIKSGVHTKTITIDAVSGKATIS